jgi:hypothetical protein
MGKIILNISELVTKIDAPMLRAPMPILNALNSVG